METFRRLGMALRFLRDRQGLSQKDVAQRAEVTAPMLSAYENDRADPELSTLDRILRLGLRVRLEDLAWALAIVNDRAVKVRSGDAREEHAGRAAQGSRTAKLDPALEHASAQIAQGLVLLCGTLIESAMRSRFDGALNSDPPGSQE